MFPVTRCKKNAQGEEKQKSLNSIIRVNFKYFDNEAKEKIVAILMQ